MIPEHDDDCRLVNVLEIFRQHFKCVVAHLCEVHILLCLEVVERFILYGNLRVYKPSFSSVCPMVLHGHVKEIEGVCGLFF